MTLKLLEERLTALERRVELMEKPASNGKWWLDRKSPFAGDPAYAEMVRLGREYRELFRPRPVSKERRPKK